MTLSGTALELFSGAGSLQLRAMLMNGSTTELFTSAGALSLPRLTFSGAAQERFSGSGKLKLRLTFDGVAFFPEGPVPYVPPDHVLDGSTSADLSRKQLPQVLAPTAFIASNPVSPVPVDLPVKQVGPVKAAPPTFFIGASTVKPAEVPSTPSGKATKPKPG